MQKLFIATELFYPEESTTSYILTQIAKKLCTKYDIEVVAGTPVYEIDESKYEELPSNIKITRVNSKKIDKNNIVARLKRAFGLSFEIKKYIARNCKPGDKIFMVTNPVLLTYILPKWAYKHKIDVTLLVHDVFPENTVAAGFINKNSLILRILISIFNRSYRKINRFIVLGNDMKEVVSKKCDDSSKVYVIQNWSEIDRITPLNIIPDESKITIQFSGNFGRVQGIADIVQIIKKVNNPILKFIFSGSGAGKKILEGCNKIELNGIYYKDEENNVLNNCDLSLVCLNEFMYGLGCPSKTYNNMAAGKPILFIGPKNSEIYNLVKENDIGYSFDIKSENDIVDFLNRLSLDQKKIFVQKGCNARKLIEQKYNSEIILNQYYELL